jgi:hypothetical protein
VHFVNSREQEWRTEDKKKRDSCQREGKWKGQHSPLTMCIVHGLMKLNHKYIP